MIVDGGATAGPHLADELRGHLLARPGDGPHHRSLPRRGQGKFAVGSSCQAVREVDVEGRSSTGGKSAKIPPLRGAPAILSPARLRVYVRAAKCHSLLGNLRVLTQVITPSVDALPGKMAGVVAGTQAASAGSRVLLPDDGEVRRARVLGRVVALVARIGHTGCRPVRDGTAPGSSGSGAGRRGR